MKQVSDYRREHEELSELVTVLRGLLTEERVQVEANARLAYDKLCTLSEKMLAHLGGEDKELYPALLNHEDPKIRNLAWGFLNNENHLRKELEKYCKAWLKSPGQPSGELFLRESLGMLDALSDRMEKEDRELYPVLESVRSAAASRARPTVDLADITLHIDEKLDPHGREGLVEGVRRLDGVISVALHERRPHLMIVEYNPHKTSSASILALVKTQGVHAELIGL